MLLRSPCGDSPRVASDTTRKRRRIPTSDRAIVKARSRYDRRRRTPVWYRENKESPMTINITVVPLISLIAGILILMFPKLLNYIVAIYLIFVGLVGIFGLRF
jgi:hypothetical protein